MKILSVLDPAFKRYGKVLKGYDFAPLVDEMIKSTPCPDDVVYVPGDAKLEAVASTTKILFEEVYGGLPIQVGYCNGHNHVLNAVEYHRSSEINIACGNDLILILGHQQDIEDDYTYDTSKMEAFLLPAGCAVEVYATSLHYAPCSVGDNGFRCVVVLPKDTNTEIEADLPATGESRLMTAKNKWLIAHPESGLDKDGAFVGLVGENLRV
ncbi:MAG: DUF4867 family protein [Oscillospiraceae bacterium]|nr:DUF4867 family protein [Oscillospiraceae bacterium]